MRLWGRREGFWAVLVGLVSLGVYLLTLAPGLTWAYDSVDGGELAACAYTLGVAHPPGYPTYVLLAHLATRLPVGEVATRTNLFSAVCAASTAALASWTLARMGAGWAAAAGAAWVLSFATLFWSQAIVTEVHALNALVFALLLSCAAVTPPNRPGLLAALTGLLWGLGLGNHPTAALGVPLVLLSLARLRRWGWGALGVLLGLSVYLCLWFWSAADPPVNWADPQTPARFWWLVSGRLYRPLVFALPPADLGARVLSWGRLLSEQFLGAGLLVAGLGAAVLWSADRALLRASGVTVALCSLFAIGYNTSDSYLYLIPVLVCVALWLGVGLDWVIAALGGRWVWAARVGCVTAVAVPLLAMSARFSTMDLGGDRAAHAFATHALEGAPPGAVLLSQQDGHTFSLWYYTIALGWRPDVVVVDLDLLGHDGYTAQLSPPLSLEMVSRLDGSADLGLLARETGRTICRFDRARADWVCWY
jgi:transmembrane protein TMEM260 (protein O-mannosyltransferase)